MKALLLKDFLTLKKMLRNILLIMLALAFVPKLNMAVFFMVYCSMLPITALGYDERTKWDVQAAMMPFRPWEIVVGKYVLGYLILAVATALSLLAGCLVGQATGAPVTADQLLSYALYAIAITLCLAVTLPLMFRFGVEKGRLAIILGFGVAFGAIASLVPFLNDHMDALMLTRAQFIALLLAASAAANALSILLSIRFYRGRMA